MNKYITTICLLIGLSATAQEPLSLEKAIKIGLKNNFDIQIARSDEEIAERNNTLLNTTFSPRASVGIDQNNRISGTDNNTGFSRGASYNSSIGPNLTLNWTLFDGLSAWYNKERLALLQEQSSGNAELVVENTVQAIILGYYNAYNQNERLNMMREMVALSKDRLKYTNIKRAVGVSSSFDVMQAENNYLQDSTNYLLQQITYDNSIRNLRQLLDMPSSWNPEISDEPTVEDQEEVTLLSIKQIVLSNNTQLKNQFLNLQIAQQGIKIAKADRYPTLNMSMGASSANVFQRQEQLDFSNQDDDEMQQPPSRGFQEIRLNFNTYNFFTNFSLNWNFFNGLSVRRNIKNAESNYQQAMLNKNKLENEVMANVERLYQTYTYGLSLFELFETREDNAKLTLDRAKELFRTGVLNSFEYRDVQIQYFQAQQSYLDNLYTLVEAETQLKQITGTLLKR